MDRTEVNQLLYGSLKSKLRKAGEGEWLIRGSSGTAPADPSPALSPEPSPAVLAEETLRAESLEIPGAFAGFGTTHPVETLAPGARVLVRDAEWLVRKVDRTSSGGQALEVVGLSELVKDKKATFLTEIEEAVQIIDPVKTELVADDSSNYRKSLLYIESLLRMKSPTGPGIHVGHRAAMDLVPYQLDPAIQALDQARTRILIADGVGLGKTLEAGILVSELARRGRGKRILVVAIKSMLTQFQKEFWNRFTIPLTRLDSIGLQRIRQKIPSNQNPFHFYDKAIISADTLKQDAEYRTYLENAYWDIIVIDEAHNVAERGGDTSQRAKLAKLLSERSDTLIMLSATPHDGRARSFASLMNMLDPTAIANPEDYKPEDIKGLFIRRFKKDIRDQVPDEFPERSVTKHPCKATADEERAFASLVDLKFKATDQRRGGSMLFRTTLEKALFSSPAACLETVANRIKVLEEGRRPDYEQDVKALQEFAADVEKISQKSFSRYQALLALLREWKWTGRDTKDRLVIFTERIATLKFLKERLQKDLGLSDKEVLALHGQEGSDKEQQDIVDAFGKDDSPARLLIGSDIASEGINLHYLSHRLVHFDLPWSLMVFQQRNGRIDRYGQKQKPLIAYLMTVSGVEKIRGDMRILELLTEKEEQAYKNIGDAAMLMGKYEVKAEETFTAKLMEEGHSREEAERLIAIEAKAAEEAQKFDPLALLMQGTGPSNEARAAGRMRELPTVFADEYSFAKAAIEHIRQENDLQTRFYDDEKRFELTIPEDFKRRCEYLPAEILPEDGRFLFSSNKSVIMSEVDRCRREEQAWPTVHYLWPMNPVMEWLCDKAVASFRRQQAPIISGMVGLGKDESIFVLSGLLPNRRGQPLIHEWFGIRFKGDKYVASIPLNDLLSAFPLRYGGLSNPDKKFDAGPLSKLLAKAVEEMKSLMAKERAKFEAGATPELAAHLKDLERLQGRQESQIEFKFQAKKNIKDRELRGVEKLFSEYKQWIKDTKTVGDVPYIQIVAVLRGEG
jgi:superfamily II DNA or RNA helicase